MPLFFITGWLLYLDRRRKKRQIKQARQGFAAPGSDASSWLIGFASQSGFAEQLAWQTAGQLQAAGLPVRVQPLATVSEQDLQQASNALFVVSTFGDGEAPDSARGFERKILGQPLELSQLNYSVLALGDSRYPHFCGFATRVQQWLSQRGAQSLFSPVQVDSGDPQALHHWQQQLGQLTGGAPSANWQAPGYNNWTLEQRQLLNPGSSGAGVYLLGLKPPRVSDSWQAGDLVEVMPRQSPAAIEHFLQGLGLSAETQVQLDGLQESLAQALGGRQLPESRGHLVGMHAQALVDALIPLQMREYSIASIPRRRPAAIDRASGTPCRWQPGPGFGLADGTCKSGFCHQPAGAPQQWIPSARRTLPADFSGQWHGAGGAAQLAQGAHCQWPAA